MIHNLVAFLVLTAVAVGAAVMVPDPIPPRDLAAAPARAARWLTARRVWRRAARSAWVAGADLATGWAMSAPTVQLPPWHDVPSRDADNACKDGRKRCRECRLGGDCRQHNTGELPVYAAGHPLPRDGCHSGPAVVARWLAGEWELAELPIGLRRQLGRLAGAVRVPALLTGPGLGVRLP